MNIPEIDFDRFATTTDRIDLVTNEWGKIKTTNFKFNMTLESYGYLVQNKEFSINVTDTKENVSSAFKILCMPNCCGVAEICNMTFVYGGATKKTFEYALKMGIDYIEASKYGIINVASTCKNQISVLESVGFKTITKFKNPNSNNIICLLQLNLVKLIN